MSVTALRLVLCGDAMLGRFVGSQIRRYGPDYPFGTVAARMRRADLAIANLECAITRCLQRWDGAAKAFYFRAPPEAVQTLVGAGIKMLSLSNNHVLDFGVRGLRDTIDALDRAGIAHAGAGADLAAALQPAIVRCKGVRIGMAAFCDHQHEFAARPGRPSIAWLDLEEEDQALEAFARALAPLGKEGIEWPILSLHWGPNMVARPAPALRRLARAAVEMGWKIVYGHSAHVFQGIELHHASPILYATGDLVDDYAVDPVFRNDHQLLFELELAQDGWLGRILLHPLFISHCRASPAGPAQAAWIARQMAERCGELGTPLERAELPWTIAPPV